MLLPQKVARTKRIEPMLQQLLASAIHKFLPEVYSQTQISHVKMSKCLRYADLYMTGQDEAPLSILRKEGWRLQKSLAGVQMRAVPKLRFHLDRRLEREIRLDGLLRELGSGSKAEDS